GIFILLACASAYFLIARKDRRETASTLILSLALFGLFASTMVYTVAGFLYMKGYFLLLFKRHSLSSAEPAMLACDCARTAALTANVCVYFMLASTIVTDIVILQILLGDGIVCWRACVVWRRNKVLVGACVALCLVTFALGSADTNNACTSSSIESEWLPNRKIGTGNLYEGSPYGVAATVLSLCTNLCATIAVALKAWYRRKTLKQYVVIGTTASRTGKMFALLVESGVIYCAIWIVLVAYQTGMYNHDGGRTADKTYLHSFWFVFGLIANSAVVPMIAIYPTIIIVLLALDRSHMESGFMKTEDTGYYRLPPHPLTVVVDTVVTTRRDPWPHSRGSFLTAVAKDVDDISSEKSLENSSTQSGYGYGLKLEATI
ncbi:hypothetical protein V8D89_000918, partial [Ganoderma adspersum]